VAPALCTHPAPVPPPSYHRTAATALHLDALTLVTRLELLALCRLAVRLAQRQCPPPLRHLAIKCGTIVGHNGFPCPLLRSLLLGVTPVSMPCPPRRVAYRCASRPTPSRET
jgi:hypothetical protein